MANRDTIRELIIENQKFVSTAKFCKRQYEFEDSLNYVLVGLRRAGKSYLMFQQIAHLLGSGHAIDEILYINFEDDRLGELSLADLDLIKTTYEAMFDCRPIFFLDEIQIITGWEKFARRLADQKYRVYITGSNAKMLSAEIATTLGGRYMIKNVYPFSFSEYLLANGVNMNEKNALYAHKNDIQKLFEQYFKFGGLPETINVQDKRSWLSNLFNKIFFGDMVSRYSVRNDNALRMLTRKLAESVKQPTSYTRLANIASTAGKKISTDTAIDYVRYMCESWLILPMENICGKLAERSSKHKYYFVDNGLISLFLLDPNTNLLENIVAIELYKQYGTNVYFYLSGVEVDFYIPEQQTAIQVAYSVADIETRKREVDALLKTSEQVEIKDMYIITKDEEELLEVNDVQIHIVPIWKWLLRAQIEQS